MTMTCEYLFVYGTLRRHTGYAMSRLLEKKTDLVGKAVFQGKLFDIGGYPGAVPSDHPPDAVCGEVVLIQETDSLLKLLDTYEECAPAEPEQGEYKREKVTVTLCSGEVMKAWMYLYNLPTDGLRRILSGDYGTMKTLL